MVMARGARDVVAGFIGALPSGRIVNIDEVMLQTELRRYMRRDGWCTIALGRMVAACQIGDPTFTCQMHLGFRDFTGDECLSTGGDSGFKIALRATRAPCNTTQWCLIFSGNKHH